MIVRTVTAHCDGPGCDETINLNPQSTQVYTDLQRLGWTNRVANKEILIYCPEHRDA